ncbi:hypothetical protein C1S82_27825 [Mycolicibacterium cosmeticum]|uniref:Transmembrane protein n=1 Tax=Mycolicibacterium cosmeticum TaxID=258533 RepID=W9BKW8_MYCCO|nr:hypothetical protein [Mycolicibacterium cosmeticum]TLH67772.1 hypothetical protein C1S82_27825 [Mycolicibacterium cosmeticum]CDO08625.1 hypothetical protein BN977_03444 [Mycolicibacterium cosmeticum]
MDDITPEGARNALETADHARRRVAAEIGLPRGYWWAMAVAWVTLGVLGDLGPRWLATIATIAFALGHSTVASRLLSGRHRSDRVQVSAATAGPRVPLVVIGILLSLVALTVAAGFALHADGVRHAGTWAAILAAAVVGFGGPEILRVTRRWAHA